MNSQEKLLEKIAKLLRMANDSGASQNEIEVAMRKANDLLVKNNLSLADVDQKEIDDSIIESDKSVTTYGDVKEEGSWEGMLAAVISKSNFCKAIKHSTRGVKNGHISVIGSKENVEVTLYMYSVARSMFRQSSKDEYNSLRKEVVERFRGMGLTERDALKSKALSYRMPWIRSYLKGCVAGLNIKLERKDQSTDQKYGIVLSKNNSAVEKFMREKYERGLKKSASRMRIGSNDAYSAGIDRGKNITFTKGVRSSHSNQLRIG